MWKFFNPLDVVAQTISSVPIDSSRRGNIPFKVAKANAGV